MKIMTRTAHPHALHPDSHPHGHGEASLRLKADLADPAGSLDPSDHLWSQWRSTALIAQGPARTARWVRETLGPAPLDVLEVGCGTGYLALDMARAGHRVQALDPDEEAIGLARRTLAAGGTAGNLARPLDLTYHETDFLTWDAGDSRFDALVFNLSLHHMDDLGAAMRKTTRLLRPGGRIVVQDYVFDRFDVRTANWLADMEAAMGLAAGDTEVSDPAKSRADLAERIAESARKHVLIGFKPLIGALREAFHETAFSWEPFMYTRIANRAGGLPEERHDRLVPFLAALERLRFEEGSIQAVCYRFLGSLEP